MHLLLIGANGRMGQEVLRQVKYQSDIQVTSVDQAPFGRELSSVEDEQFDVALDFSHHKATQKLLDFATKRNLPCVIATTGHTKQDRESIQAASQRIAILLCENLSFGSLLFFRLAKEVISFFPKGEGEILEIHRKGKKDTPSGTAKKLKEYLLKEPGEEISLPIRSLRIGDVVGTHSLRFGNTDETVTITHQVRQRSLFAKGGLLASRFLLGKPAGIYRLEDVIGEKNGA